jgi:hypothetical protein
MIGCDADKENQSDLMKHLREAFHVDKVKHEQLLDIARMREVNLGITGSHFALIWKLSNKTFSLGAVSETQP